MRSVQIIRTANFNSKIVNKFNFFPICFVVLTCCLFTGSTFAQPTNVGINVSIRAEFEGTDTLAFDAEEGDILEYYVTVSLSEDQFPIFDGEPQLVLPDGTVVDLDDNLALSTGGSKAYAPVAYVVSAADLGQQSGAESNEVRALASVTAKANTGQTIQYVSATTNFDTIFAGPTNVGISVSIRAEFQGTNDLAFVATPGDVLKYIVTISLSADQFPIENGKPSLTLPNGTVIGLDNNLALATGGSIEYPPQTYTVSIADLGQQPGACANEVRALASVTAKADTIQTIQDVSATTNFDTIVINPCVDVDKVASCDIAKENDIYNYTITITNCGAEELTVVSIEDTMFGSLLPDCGMLAPGQYCVIQIPYEVQPGDPDPLLNVVTVVYEVTHIPPITVTDISSAVVDIIYPDFTVTKECLTDNVDADEVTFLITIDNTGDVPLDFEIDDEAAGIVDLIVGPIAPGENYVTTVEVPADCVNGAVSNRVVVQAYFEGQPVLEPMPAEAECPCVAEPSQEVTRISNCRIQNNSAQEGGGIYINDTTEIRNCLISDNTASSAGGGLFENASVFQYGNTIAYNTSQDGGGIFSTGGSSILTNTILWGNGEIPLILMDSTVDISFSDIEGGSAAIGTDPNSILNWGSGNIDTDPTFNGLSEQIVDWETWIDRNGNIWTLPIYEEIWDYHLQPDSPCIDMGDPNYIPEPDETDLKGNPRIINARIDMGPYEYQEPRVDLLITSENIAFGPVPAMLNQPATISATVWNTGYALAENVTVTFSDTTGLIGSEVIPLLDPNQTETVSIQHTWLEASFQMITMAVDPTNAIDEIDETNNTASKVYQVGNPADPNAILEVAWNAPSCYTENTSQVIQGQAVYRIGGNGGLDVVTPALGSMVTAQMTAHGSGTITNLQSTFTGIDGYFYIPFIVPSVDEEAFTIQITVTDGTLTGTLEKAFCIQLVPPPLTNDLWVCGLTLSDETPDVGVPVSLCADICADPANDQTFENKLVYFYAYPPSGGSYMIGSGNIAQIAPGQTQTVCVDWTPLESGSHQIRASIDILDTNHGNNHRYEAVLVGMLNITASPSWATLGQQVQIIVDSREPMPSDQLDLVQVFDSDFNFIEFSLVEHIPASTRWVYLTVALPEGTAFGQARIEVVANDPNDFYQGYFYVFETLPNFWLNSCDITPDKLNPSLAEPIGLNAVVHAASSNPPESEDMAIPVTFYSKHLPTDSAFIKIGQTQYTGGILTGGVSDPVSVSWQNAANGEYIIKAELSPGFSDNSNGDNSATRAVLVGNEIPFIVEFEVLNKTRMGRTTFDYECNVIMHNQTGLTLENVELELTGLPLNMTLLDPNYIAVIGSIGPNGTAVADGTCTFRVERSEPITSAQINWNAVYQIVDTCGLMQQMSMSIVQLEAIPGDMTGEGTVDFEDLKLLAEQWLQTPGVPSADIAPPPDGDGKVNLLDFALLAENWMR
jgi:hypothetical protein